MDTLGNAILGLVFLGLSIASTFLMFKLWGYPFDKEKLKSGAPWSLVLLHRLMGYAYLIIYIYLMAQMLPRMWSYQVEFPARTVAHLMLGMTIGIILFTKIMIVRYFKYLEARMIPTLGTALMVCTFLLIGLSVPFVFREVALQRNVAGQSVHSPQNVQRVAGLLPTAGLHADAPLAELATVKGLRKGREVLLRRCVNCHDLRTILLRPRTPKNWVKTVTRMADRSQLWDPLSEQEQWAVSAYLIAITPHLQKSIKRKRKEEMERERSKTGLEKASAVKAEAPSGKVTPPFEIARAKQLFETVCSQCHETSDVHDSPPTTEQEAIELVIQMVENGLSERDEDLQQIIYYLTQTYAKRTG